MVSHFNYLVFGHACCVYHNLVVDWTGWSSFWVFVCNHVKIEKFVAIAEHDIFLYYSSWFRIHLILIVCISEESCDIVFINQYIQNVRIITWVELLDCFFELILRFKHQEVFFVGWTSDSISINNNLTGTFIFINFSPIFQRINNEIKDNFCSFWTNFII